MKSALRAVATLLLLSSIPAAVNSQEPQISAYGGLIVKRFKEHSPLVWTNAVEFELKSGAVAFEAEPLLRAELNGEKKKEFEFEKINLTFESGHTEFTAGAFITPFNTWIENSRQPHRNDASFSQPWVSAFAPTTSVGLLVRKEGGHQGHHTALDVYAGFEANSENVFAHTRDIIGMRFSKKNARSNFGISAALDNLSGGAILIAATYGNFRLAKGPFSATVEAGYSGAIGWGYWVTVPVKVGQKTDVLVKHETLFRTADKEHYYHLKVPGRTATDLYVGLRSWRGENVRLSAAYKFGFGKLDKGLVASIAYHLH